MIHAGRFAFDSLLEKVRDFSAGQLAGSLGQRPRITAIEGPVCAGKSTLLRQLAAEGCSVIGEYADYVKSPADDFPCFPPSDESDAVAAYRFFLSLERARRRDLEAAADSQAQKLLDRSILTLVAFQLGAALLTEIDALPELLSELAATPDAWIWPTNVVYLDIRAAVARQRDTRPQTRRMAFLHSEAFNRGFRAAFAAMSEAAPHVFNFVDASRDDHTTYQQVKLLL